MHTTLSDTHTLIHNVSKHHLWHIISFVFHSRFLKPLSNKNRMEVKGWCLHTQNTHSASVTELSKKKLHYVFIELLEIRVCTVQNRAGNSFKIIMLLTLNQLWTTSGTEGSRTRQPVGFCATWDTTRRASFFPSTFLTFLWSLQDHTHKHSKTRLEMDTEEETETCLWRTGEMMQKINK